MAHQRAGGFVDRDLVVVPTTHEEISVADVQQAGVWIISFNNHDGNLRKVLTHPLTSIITDGLVVEGISHPRTFGTYAKLLGEFVREKGWFTLEGGVSRFDSNVEDFDAIWAYRVAPSMTLSVRGGPILFEPTIGFAFSRAFKGVDDADTTITFNPSFSVKYRGEKFRPQFNFAYSKVLAPKIVSGNEDGVISIGPEILYAISPNILIGGAYSYSTPLTKDIDVNSHTVTLEFRWIF